MPVFPKARFLWFSTTAHFSKKKTRLKVAEAIEQLGYVCNNNARGLRKCETKCFGIIVAVESKAAQTYAYDQETGLFSYNITNGIPAGLAGTDYGLLTERYCAAEAGGDLPAIIKNGRIDGVFLVGGLFEDRFKVLLDRGIHLFDQ